MSLVIPTIGNSKSLLRLLNSIENQRKNFSLQVIIVCNSVYDLTKVKILQDYLNKTSKQAFEFHSLGKAGVNRSRNHGLCKAKFPIILFIDDDCEMDNPLLLQMHFDLHRDRLDLFGVGGVYQLPKEATKLSRIYHEIQMTWLYQGLLSETSGRQTNYLIGGHFSVKKLFVDSRRLRFDENIIYGGSELSFFAQARSTHLPLELHEMSVLHHTRETFFSLQKKMFKQGKGLAILERTFKTSADSKRSSKLGATTTERLIHWYFAQVFWLGYFDQKNNRLGFILFFLRNFKNRFSYLKYKKLDETNALIESKKQRGDRF